MFLFEKNLNMFLKILFSERFRVDAFSEWLIELCINEQ